MKALSDMALVYSPQLAVLLALRPLAGLLQKPVACQTPKSKTASMPEHWQSWSRSWEGGSCGTAEAALGLPAWRAARGSSNGRTEEGKRRGAVGQRHRADSRDASLGSPWPVWRMDNRERGQKKNE
ncbi:hypothetical protein SEVIR_4G214301v4 [Setaria viridis]|uniref:Uncharacterized protein n=1 Tax=Setaria viridis TaxID=4556 RepID=A0A4U6V2F5_SETVI|nr:hypothetical protein SEVIR_4G214301v2 [Setaria viridis]TKW22205.1 hypothetical protein SEVIR_4G214301v2 [Setaria viridis]